MALPTPTKEQLDERRKKAIEKRLQQSKDRENNIHNLKLDWADSYHWKELGSKYGIRMPNDRDPVTSSGILKCLKKADVPIEIFNEHYTSRQYFVNNNKNVSMYALMGMLLELKDEYC